MAKLNLAERIDQLEAATKSGQMTVGFALARLSLDYLEGSFAEYNPKVGGAPTVARVSFRKNVEVAPFKHEHAEVTVECNGASLAEAAQLAKDSVAEVLGEKELRTAQEQIENAKRVLREAGLRQKKARGAVHDRALVDALRWGDDD